jgi:hypothetical protein
MDTPELQFEALRPATHRRRVVLLLVGPLLWLAGLVVVAIVLNRRDVIEIGFLIAGVTFLVGVVLLLLARRDRIREGERGAPGG